MSIKMNDIRKFVGDYKVLAGEEGINLPEEAFGLLEKVLVKGLVKTPESEEINFSDLEEFDKVHNRKGSATRIIKGIKRLASGYPYDPRIVVTNKDAIDLYEATKYHPDLVHYFGNASRKVLGEYLLSKGLIDQERL